MLAGCVGLSKRVEKEVKFCQLGKYQGVRVVIKNKNLGLTALVSILYNFNFFIMILNLN